MKKHRSDVRRAGRASTLLPAVALLVRRCLLILLPVLGGLPGEALAQSETSPTELDDVVQRYVDLDRFTGSVLVAHGNRVLLSKGYGAAHREFDVPNTPRTRFDIGSTAKSFTAAAVLRLVADGRIGLHEPIVRYLPDYPRPQGERVTIHHLLTHTSGIPSLGRRDGIPDSEVGAALYAPVALDELLDIVKDRELQFEPGSEYRYNNSAFAIAAAVVEAVAEMPFGEFLREAILEPAGLHDTGVHTEPEVVRQMATGYVGYEPHVERVGDFHPSWGIGAGSMVSTVEDLARWGRALTSDGVLPRAQRELMARPHVERNSYDYGYGLFLETVHGRPVLGHGGTTGGFVTEFAVYPGEDLVIAVITNLQPELGVNIPAVIGRQLAATVFGLDTDLPPRVVDVDSAALARLEGLYALDGEHRIRVWAEDGRLRARAEDGGNWSLMTYSRGRDLDTDDPSVRRAETFLRALLAGDSEAFMAALRPDRRADFDADYAPDFSRRMRRQWGDIGAVTPYFLDASPGEAIVMARVSAADGAFYLHAEIEPGEGVFGWYLDETLPAAVQLLPTSDTTFFIDAFPHRGPMDPVSLPVSFEIADGRAASLTVGFRGEDLIARRVQE